MGHFYHDHEHDHDHPHEHPHTHDFEDTDHSEVKALLEFMIQHNEHHNDELADLLDQLPPAARKKLSIAIGSFEAANVELRAVLDCLD